MSDEITGLDDRIHPHPSWQQREDRHQRQLHDAHSPGVAPQLTVQRRHRESHDQEMQAAAAAPRSRRKPLGMWRVIAGDHHLWTVSQKNPRRAKHGEVLRGCRAADRTARRSRKTPPGRPAVVPCANPNAAVTASQKMAGNIVCADPGGSPVAHQPRQNTAARARAAPGAGIAAARRNFRRDRSTSARHQREHQPPVLKVMVRESHCT